MMIRIIYYVIILELFSLSLSAEHLECTKILVNKKSLLGNDCQRENDLINISIALDKSFHQHFNYTQPETMHFDTSISQNSHWSPNSDLRLLLKENFLKILPLDPINNSEYYYTYEPLNDLYHPYYQLCASKLETTQLPYCIEPKNYNFYSDHLFVATEVKNIGDVLLKIVTANILYGGGKPGLPSEVSALELQVSVLKTYVPDIVFFQEVELHSPRTLTRDRQILNDNETAIDYFSRKLNLQYHYFQKFVSFKFGMSGTAILSKYPIVTNEKINRHLSIVGIDTNNDDKQDIILANMHLKPKGLQGSRQNMIYRSIKKVILKYGEYPIILAGDFFEHNLDLELVGFKDSYVECGKHDAVGLKYFNTSINKKKRRLDYIFMHNILCTKESNMVLFKP